MIAWIASQPVLKAWVKTSCLTGWIEKVIGLMPDWIEKAAELTLGWTIKATASIRALIEPKNA